MKKLLTNEQSAIKLLKDNNLTELNLWCLIEVGTCKDSDGDEVTMTANNVFINDGDNSIYLRDKDYTEEVWKFSELSVPIQQDTLWTMRQTLKI